MQYLVVLVFLFALLYDYKRAVMLLVPLHLVLLMLVFPGTPFSNFDVVAALVTFLAPFKLSQDEKALMKSYPFWFGSFLMLFSIAGTSLLIEPHWPTALMTFNAYYIFPLILWMCIETKEELMFLLKVIAFFAIAMGLYCLFEMASASNPYIRYLISSGLGNVSVLDYDKFRFGIKRCQGFLSTPAPTGLFFGLILSSYYWIADKFSVDMKKALLLLFPLCAVGVLITGTRSVIAATCVALIGVVAHEIIKPRYIFIKIVGVIVVLALSASFLMEVVGSFINTDQTAVSGSNTDMRQEQLLISLFYWANSPIWGNGSGFIWHYVQEVDKGIYGAESIWFQILVDFGAVGAFAYMACIFNAIVSLWKKHFVWVFLPLGFLVGKTLSTVIGIEMSVLFLFSIILLKYEILFNTKEDDIEDEQLEETP
jgi:hypothetical protein